MNLAGFDDRAEFSAGLGRLGDLGGKLLSWTASKDGPHKAPSTQSSLQMRLRPDKLSPDKLSPRCRPCCTEVRVVVQKFEYEREYRKAGCENWNTKLVLRAETVLDRLLSS